VVPPNHVIQLLSALKLDPEHLVVLVVKVTLVMVLLVKRSMIVLPPHHLVIPMPNAPRPAQERILVSVMRVILEMGLFVKKYWHASRTHAILMLVALRQDREKINVNAVPVS
jgi:hypothetical protein